jgi:hypothetical protein
MIGAISKAVFDYLESGQLSAQWPLFPYVKHLPGLFYPALSSAQRLYCTELSCDAFSPSQILFFFQLSGRENQYTQNVNVMSKLKETHSILENSDMRTQRIIAVKEETSEVISLVRTGT